MRGRYILGSHRFKGFHWRLAFYVVGIDKYLRYCIYEYHAARHFCCRKFVFGLRLMFCESVALFGTVTTVSYFFRAVARNAPIRKSVDLALNLKGSRFSGGRHGMAALLRILLFFVGSLSVRWRLFAGAS